jgi:ubiquinone/menaquinone biosynthesis C-methylase UbiE
LAWGWYLSNYLFDFAAILNTANCGDALSSGGRGSVRPALIESSGCIALKNNSLRWAVPREDAQVEMTTTDLMRQDWDDRARKDAFHYIASWRKDWTPESFFVSGEEDYQRLVAPVLERAGWSAPGKTMLELGCGAGRMTRSFAQRFARVYAFDISTEMLGHAKALFPEATNVEWILGNGTDLSTMGDEAVDFAFSYIVLQHMPEPIFALRYIREMLRVLKPGGKFLFQFNSLPKMTMNWKGRLAWRIVDFPWALGFRRASRGVAELLGLSPEIAGKSWRGPSLSVKAVRDTIEAAGATVQEVTGGETPMTWCSGSKSRVQAQ